MIVGVRVLVGSQAIERAPSFVELFGRTVQFNLSRARWFDLPFTREESLNTDKKFNLFCMCSYFVIKIIHSNPFLVGASQDVGGVTMIDSVKVHALMQYNILYTHLQTLGIWQNERLLWLARRRGID